MGFYPLAGREWGAKKKGVGDMVIRVGDQWQANVFTSLHSQQLLEGFRQSLLSC